MHCEAQHSRRAFVAGNILSTIPFLTPSESFAEQAEVDLNIFTRRKENQFGYTLNLPLALNPGNKPLQTHLDEVNLATSMKGYTYGITVDPIRIASLKEFGTPEEVCAKIILAELRRDGILDVTVGRDPTEDVASGGYDIEYISDGKRGKKHFYTRTIVKSGKLYVLTAQCKEDDWAQVENEVIKTVNSFRALEA